MLKAEDGDKTLTNGDNNEGRGQIDEGGFGKYIKIAVSESVRLSLTLHARAVFLALSLPKRGPTSIPGEYTFPPFFSRILPF